jgi:hypothetical protein
MAKLFTLEEAEKLIPSLEQWLPEAIIARKQAVEAQQGLQEIASRVQMLGGVELDPERVGGLRRRQQQAVQQLQAATRQIEESGCMLKDLEVGLIDFPAILGGEPVLLCWKLGERRIEYWHRSDEGFAGRKRINPDPGSSGGGQRPS